MSVIFLYDFRDFPPWFIDEIDWLPFLLDDLRGPSHLVGKRLGMPGCLGFFNDGDCWLKILFVLLILVGVRDRITREEVNMGHFSSLTIFDYIIVLV